MNSTQSREALIRQRDDLSRQADKSLSAAARLLVQIEDLQAALGKERAHRDGLTAELRRINDRLRDYAADGI